MFRNKLILIDCLCFNKEFIKTGIISEEYGDFYNRVVGFRQRADYEDFVEFEHEKVKSWFDSTKDFIDSIEEVIQEAINKADA